MNGVFMNPERYGPWVLIAGASDGIGEAFARQLAGQGFKLVLIARRGEVLGALAADLVEQYGVEVRGVSIDLTSADLLENLRQVTDGLEIGLLIYNAGAVHGASFFHDQSLAHVLGLISLNCTGPASLCHHYGGLMRERGRGGIILLSSMAALSGGSYTAAYNATKSFDLILAESLWHELAPGGVDAMCLIAGATLTPSMLASQESFAQYPNAMKPGDVAAEGLAWLGKGPVWVAGSHNRDAAKMLWPVPRTLAINGFSEAAAGLYELPFTAVDGEDFNKA
jgi:short-subunit dehydrogenase